MREPYFKKDIGCRIINSLTIYFQSPSRQSSVALELQSPDAWSGSNHLSARLQDSCVCVPPEVVEALNVWLTGHCESHASRQNQCTCCTSSGSFAPTHWCSRSWTPNSPIQFSGGPVRLTGFVKMPLDTCCAHWNLMVSQGRLEHIGRAKNRPEGTTAWGV